MYISGHFTPTVLIRPESAGAAICSEVHEDLGQATLAQHACIYFSLCTPGKVEIHVGEKHTWRWILPIYAFLVPSAEEQKWPRSSPGVTSLLSGG